jgi:primosomal protein N' (replication factor Y)
MEAHSIMRAEQDAITLAQVAVAAPVETTLSYEVPETLSARLKIGSRIKVPLGRRFVVGYVMALTEGTSHDLKHKLKRVETVLDQQPLFHEQHAKFYQRAADYYAFPVGEAVRTALPAGLSGRGQEPAILYERLYRPTGIDGHPSGMRQNEILNRIRQQGVMSLTSIRSAFKSPYNVLQRLQELGFLAVEQVERCRQPFSEVAVARQDKIDLTQDQNRALDVLRQAVVKLPAFSAYLLQGVTGSGKTEVYFQLIAETLEQGYQVLLLVPEIALTPQLIGRFLSWFQERRPRLAVLHSALSDGERFDAWRKVANGEIDVVIGARSAVFAPLPKLGLVVVDEEHDSSYKQSEAFRYNARDLALMRGQMENAVVLLGSATPALTSYRRALTKQMTHLALPARATGRQLPDVYLVDMKPESSDSSISEPLRDALEGVLNEGEQALILLNRRGYAPFLLCHDCGATLHCPNCAITLTFSQVQTELRCHYCDYRQRPPQACLRCAGQNLVPEGFGTERLEAELSGLFPAARIARMDRDTTGRKGAHQRMIENMETGELDILLGTQMIAKGHNFPAVTLVGVINADAALHLPDFRSSERVFALLSQVSGRAGRGTRPGKVLIQTYDPEHVTLSLVARHDYAGFAQSELAQRQALGYPPYGHLVNLVLMGNDAKKVETLSGRLTRELAAMACNVDILGPADCLVSRIRGKKRMQILLKAETRQPLRRMIGFLKSKRCPTLPGVTVTVDVDPLDMF